MRPIRWSPQQVDRLEQAARRGLRVTVTRRGSEFVVVARRVAAHGQRDALYGVLPMTGEELVFPLDEIEHFEVIGS